MATRLDTMLEASGGNMVSVCFLLGLDESQLQHGQNQFGCGHALAIDKRHRPVAPVLVVLGRWPVTPHNFNTA